MSLKAIICVVSNLAFYCAPIMSQTTHTELNALIKSGNTTVDATATTALALPTAYGDVLYTNLKNWQ